MERLMHYVWQHRLVLPTDMVTTDGQRVEVVDPGLLNRDAGPDFFNAKVRIGDRIWCGNVEMHLRASDWHRHGHSSDPAYSSVILHVVGASDCHIDMPDGRQLPQMVMQCSPDFSRKYQDMVDSPSDRLACFEELRATPSIYVTDCLTAMAFQRIYDKVDRITALMDRPGGSWVEAFYITLARALGFGLNSEPFEQLAISTPLMSLLKHRDIPEAVEGLLFGQAGLLPGAIDSHAEILQREYEFLCNKFAIQRPACAAWKMARTRPQNFPHRRIAALASMISDGFTISMKVCAVETLTQARELFEHIALPPYWQRRYTFGPESGRYSLYAFSKASVDVIIINVVVPAIYAYGMQNGIPEMQERAIRLLEEIPPENNNIVRLFRQAGVECRDAFTSQGIIQLRRAFCEQRKCLYCRLGHRFLSQKAKYRPI